MPSRIYFQLYELFSYRVYEGLSRMGENELMLRSSCRNCPVIHKLRSRGADIEMLCAG